MRVKKLRVFDFDDTLVKTNSFIYITNGEITKKLSPGEYAIYEEKSGDGNAGEAKLSQFDMRSPRKGSLAVLLRLLGVSRCCSRLSGVSPCCSRL